MSQKRSSRLDRGGLSRNSAARFWREAPLVFAGDAAAVDVGAWAPRSRPSGVMSPVGFVVLVRLAMATGTTPRGRRCPGHRVRRRHQARARGGEQAAAAARGV